MKRYIDSTCSVTTNTMPIILGDTSIVEIQKINIFKNLVLNKLFRTGKKFTIYSEFNNKQIIHTHVKSTSSSTLKTEASLNSVTNSIFFLKAIFLPVYRHA